MSIEQFRESLSELYQGEILGEVLFDHMLSHFHTPDEQYKLSLLLQLETETKARLRPALAALRVDFREQAEFKQMAVDLAGSLEGKSWNEAITTLRDVVEPAVDRYKTIAANAPAEYTELAQAMVTHEQALFDFLQLELAGKGNVSIDSVYDQISNKFSPAPSNP